MISVAGVLIGIVLVVFSIIYAMRYGKKEDYRRANAFIPFISGILLFGIGSSALDEITISGYDDDSSVQLDESNDQTADTNDDETNNSIDTLSETTSTTVTLGPGTFYVGTDINPGRYLVSTQSDIGNFVVYDSDGMPVVNETLGSDKQFGVNDLTVDLKDGQKIEISGLQSVTFNPYE